MHELFLCRSIPNGREHGFDPGDACGRRHSRGAPRSAKRRERSGRRANPSLAQARSASGLARRRGAVRRDAARAARRRNACRARRRRVRADRRVSLGGRRRRVLRHLGLHHGPRLGAAVYGPGRRPDLPRPPHRPHRADLLGRDHALSRDRARGAGIPQPRIPRRALCRRLLSLHSGDPAGRPRAAALWPRLDAELRDVLLRAVRAGARTLAARRGARPCRRPRRARRDRACARAAAGAAAVLDRPDHPRIRLRHGARAHLCAGRPPRSRAARAPFHRGPCDARRGGDASRRACNGLSRPRLRHPGGDARRGARLRTPATAQAAALPRRAPRSATLPTRSTSSTRS